MNTFREILDWHHYWKHYLSGPFSLLLARIKMEWHVSVFELVLPFETIENGDAWKRRHFENATFSIETPKTESFENAAKATDLAPEYEAMEISEKKKL